jgi:hypothetical protein
MLCVQLQQILPGIMTLIVTRQLGDASADPNAHSLIRCRAAAILNMFLHRSVRPRVKQRVR